MILANDCLTVAQLTLALEEQEVIELSNLTDPLSPTIDTAKVQFAIDRAVAFINSYYLISSDCGKAYIKTQCTQLAIWISRYYMDTQKVRPFCAEDYDRAVKILEYACTECVKACPLSDEEITAILGVLPKIGRFRAHTGGIRAYRRGVGRINPYTISPERNDYYNEEIE